MAQQLVIDKVIIGTLNRLKAHDSLFLRLLTPRPPFLGLYIGSGISGVSCFNWLAHHPSKQSVVLVDRLPSFTKQKAASVASQSVSKSANVVTSASIASGCWVTPTLPGSDTQQITQLLSDAHPHALAFYDRLGAQGLTLPWRLYRKDSIPKEVWDSKVPKWFDVRRKEDEHGEQIFECEGKEFRFFDDPEALLSQIIQDSIINSPACRYMPDTHITRLEPVVSKKRFGNKSSTHVQWILHGTHTSSEQHPGSKNLSKERPLIRAKQVILANGADFLGDGPTAHVPELQYMLDTLRISRGSVIDLESATSSFEPLISQQNVVLAPLRSASSYLEEGSADTASSIVKNRARLGSTQRVHQGDELEAAEDMLKLASESFADLPSDAVITSIRTGERVYRANRLPIVGGLLDPFGALRMYPNSIHGGALPPSAPRLSGLYFIGGMGSRGFTLAPLLSRMLVEQLLGPFDTNAALGPSRVRTPIEPLPPIEAGISEFASQSPSSLSKTLSGAPDNLEELKSQWWSRFAPRKVLTAWLRRTRPSIGSSKPHWTVDWPHLLNASTPFPEDYHEASDSFNVIPTSWDPNRAHFESTYCPLFDDDHTRD